MTVPAHSCSRKTLRASTSTSDRLQLFLVEENPLAASFLSSILGDHFDLQTINVTALTKGKKQSGIAVIVVDLSALRMPASQLLPRLQQGWDDARIVVLDFPLPKPEWLPLLPWGVRGFVPYSDAAVHLRQACCAVHAGKMWMSRALLELYFENSATGTRHKSDPSLTRRETAIAELVRQRLSNKEIAFRLQITESTVKFHLKNIFAKLQIHDRNDLQPLVGEFSLKSTAT